MMVDIIHLELKEIQAIQVDLDLPVFLADLVRLVFLVILDHLVKGYVVKQKNS